MPSVEQVLDNEICAGMRSDPQPGYTFYTKNKNFHRLHGLYRMVFDVKYRETLAKDSSHEYLSKGWCA